MAVICCYEINQKVTYNSCDVVYIYCSLYRNVNKGSNKHTLVYMQYFVVWRRQEDKYTVILYSSLGAGNIKYLIGSQM
jgi:hypothetical protein